MESKDKVFRAHLCRAAEGVEMVIKNVAAECVKDTSAQTPKVLFTKMLQCEKQFWGAMPSETIDICEVWLAQVAKEFGDDKALENDLNYYIFKRFVVRLSLHPNLICKPLDADGNKILALFLEVCQNAIYSCVDWKQWALEEGGAEIKEKEPAAPFSMFSRPFAPHPSPLSSLPSTTAPLVASAPTIAPLPTQSIAPPLAPPSLAHPSPLPSLSTFMNSNREAYTPLFPKGPGEQNKTMRVKLTKHEQGSPEAVKHRAHRARRKEEKDSDSN